MFHINDFKIEFQVNRTMLINHMSREQLPHTMIVASNTCRSPKKTAEGEKRID